MKKAKLTLAELKQKMKLLGLISAEGNPLAYAAFKNRASICNFGDKYKVVFVGIPQKNLFGFYVTWGTDPEVMKEAYGHFITLVKGDTTPYDNKYIQWGNAGIPEKYVQLKSK